jgi:5-methyltetrahydropteroyltriglutamate--homocysteine methyltransferase
MATRFNADVVGSFLRPRALLDARASGVAGAQLRAVEDDAIRQVLALQAAIGLPLATDGEFRRGHWTHLVMALADGFELQQVGELALPVPVAPLRRKASVVEAEFAFLRAHTDRPIKLTLPTPSALGSLWRAEVSAAAYPTRDAFIAALCELLNADARALAAAGAAYLQLDAPHYTVMPPGTPAADYRAMLDIDNRVFAGVTGVVTAAHLCRGNYRRPADAPAIPYDAYAALVFGGLRVDRLLLEYDDYQAGDFAPLRHVPSYVTVVLGLVTTKWPRLETEDALLRRIEAATEFIPLERLALSPQCGFSSLATLQNVTPALQRAKLELIVRVAERVWGHA